MPGKGKIVARSVSRSKTPVKAKSQKDRSRSRTQSKAPRVATTIKQVKVTKRAIDIDELLGAGHQQAKSQPKQSTPNHKQPKVAPARPKVQAQLDLTELLFAPTQKSRQVSVSKPQAKVVAQRQSSATKKSTKVQAKPQKREVTPKKQQHATKAKQTGTSKAISFDELLGAAQPRRR